MVHHMDILNTGTADIARVGSAPGTDDNTRVAAFVQPSRVIVIVKSDLPRLTANGRGRRTARLRGISTFITTDRGIGRTGDIRSGDLLNVDHLNAGIVITAKVRGSPRARHYARCTAINSPCNVIHISKMDGSGRGAVITGCRAAGRFRINALITSNGQIRGTKYFRRYVIGYGYILNTGALIAA